MKIKDILKTEKIIKISPEETLSSALSKLATSHDAAFVFSDDEKKYLGIINPYYCLIKTSFPGNTKVAHCIFHAPHVFIDDSLSRLATLFIDSKIHYLPVFDRKKEFLGIVSARHLVSKFIDSPIFKIKISQALQSKKRPLITIYEDDTVSTAINSFKKEKVSKLIVVGRDMKLKGILSYYDLVAYLISPKNSESKGDRVGNRTNFFHQKIKNFYKSYVLTLNSENSLLNVLNLILEKRIGSVVVIDIDRHPVGIITTKDLLRLFFGINNSNKIEVTSKNLSPENRQIVGGFFNQFAETIKKIPEITRAKLFVKEEKGGNLFKVALSLIPKRGNPTVIKEEGKDLIKILKKIKKD